MDKRMLIGFALGFLAYSEQGKKLTSILGANIQKSLNEIKNNVFENSESEAIENEKELTENRGDNQ